MGIVDFVDNNSFLNRMDPRIKIIILIIFSVIIFMMNSLISVTLMLVLAVVCWNICKLPFKDISGLFKVVLVTMIVVTIMQVLFYSSNNPIDFGAFQVTRDDYIFGLMVPREDRFGIFKGFGPRWQGLIFSVLLTIRLMALITFMPMIIKTTRLDQLSLGFVGLGLPYKVAYMATTAINMVPTFSDETQVIMDAQKMRGMTVFEEGKLKDKIKGWTTLVVPLVIGAMRRSQQMGVAMDTRAFGASKKRTYLEQLQLKKSDIIALIIAILLAAALLFVNYAIPYTRIIAG